MALNPILSLSCRGLISDIASKGDLIMALYYASDASQSTLYRGNIRSLQNTIHLCGDNKTLLADTVTKDVASLFGAVFDGTNVSVTIDDTSSDGTNRFTINISVTVTVGGVTYAMPYESSSFNGVLGKIVRATTGVSV